MAAAAHDYGFVHDPDDPRPVAATFRSRVFNASEGFVQAQAANLRRYQPVVVGLTRVGNVHPALQDRLIFPASAAEKLRFQIFGQTGSLAPRLREWEPKILHAHFGTDGLMALPLARALGIPLLTTLRGYDVNVSAAKLLVSGNTTWAKYALARRRLMAGGDLFLAVSDFLRRRAVELGYPAERTITHYNGADLARFRPGEEPRTPGLVVHVGRLVRKKGTRLLVRAFARVKREVPGARLVIVGAGPFEEKIRREIAEAGVGDCVELVGHKSADEIAAWLRRASVFAAPSITGRSGDAEGLPNVVVEAIACGVPVVATRHAGIPEAVVDGENGLLVPERDASALAGALSRLLQSAEMRGRMGEAGRRIAEEKFDSARQMERLESYYDALSRRSAEAAAEHDLDWRRGGGIG